MTHQFVRCDNGHRLKASPKLFGQTRPCPECGEPVAIPSEPPPHPLLNVEAPKKSVSDSSFMRVLGTAAKLPTPPPVADTPESQTCPRCGCSFSVASNVCSHCQCYVGQMPGFLQRMVGRGKH